MREIESRVIGKLKEDEQYEGWWESDFINIPFFDGKKLKITFLDLEDEKDLKEADLAIERFLQKGKIEREAISNLVYRNCMENLEGVGYNEFNEKLWDIKDEKEIWKFVYPSGIEVTKRPYKEQDMYVQICCECEWEIEHGLQIIYRQGKQVTRVSYIDGHITEADAYGKPDWKDELLSKFKE